MTRVIKVLLLAANPKDSEAGLRFDHEIRGAIAASRSGRAETELEFASEIAVRADDLLPAFLRHEPQIVHFTGHGHREKGIVMDNGEIAGVNQLAPLFDVFREVRVLFLNACETLPLAQELSTRIDYVVAMERGIYDNAAVGFASAFYAALAFGRTVPFAFEMASKIMSAEFGSEHALPHLVTRLGAAAAPLAGKPARADSRTRVKQNQFLIEVEADEISVINRAVSAAAIQISQENHIERSKLKGQTILKNEFIG